MDKKAVGRLLGKKKYTGEQVGRGLIASFLYELSQPEADANGKKKTLFTDEELKKMEASFADNKAECEVYASYLSLYKGIIQAYNYMNAVGLQFYHGFYRNFLDLEEARTAEESITALHKQPIIMTRKQYNRLKDRVESERNNKQITLETAVRDIVAYYIYNPDEEAPKGIREALEAYKKEACTNQRIIDNHNIDNNIGSWIDEEGNELNSPYSFKAMDTMPDTKKLTKTEDAEGTKFYYFVKASELIFKGWEAVQEHFKDLNLTEEEAKKVTAFLKNIKDGSEEDIDLTTRELEAVKSLLDIKEKKGASFKFADPPTDLDKYTALESDLGRYFNLYGTRYDAKTGEDLDEISKEEQFNEFKQDYPELYKAVLTYIKKLYSKKATACAKAPFTTLATWEDLAEKGVATYSLENNEATEEEIIQAYLNEEGNEGLPLEKSLNRHIAIIDHPDNTQIDEEGNYRQEQLSIIENNTLEALTERSWENNPEGIKEQLIDFPLRYLYAFFEMLSIIEEVYCISTLRELIETSMDMEDIKNKAFLYNSLIYLINGQFYGNKETREKKQKLLQEYFKPIEMESYKPEQKRIDAVTEALRKYKKKNGKLHINNLLFPYIEYLRAGGKLPE